MRIAEWAEFEAATPQSDVDENPDIRIQTRQADPAVEDLDYSHDVPGVGSFVIRGGSEIYVTEDPGGEPGLLTAYLTSSVWGALCYQRGLTLLHASVIRARGHVFAFAGHSGAGKSSLAAWLVRRGYETISDDTSRLEVVGDRIMLYPSGRRLKLWIETLRALGSETDRLVSVQAKFDKFYVPTDGASSVDPLPLDAVYLLEWGDLALQRMTGAAALRRFLQAATYRAELLPPLGATGAHVQTAIQIVKRLPVFELRRPKDLAAAETAVDLLERHWNDEFL